MYTFASDSSYAAVLTQKNQENNEAPIAFMSSSLNGAKLNYPEVDKQAFAIFKSVKPLEEIWGLKWALQENVPK